jgi:hypothetical protein
LDAKSLEEGVEERRKQQGELPETTPQDIGVQEKSELDFAIFT